MTEIIIPHKCEFVMVDGIPENAKCRYCGKSILEGVVLPEPEVEKPLEFQRYRSITNTYMKNYVDRVFMEGHHVGEWVAINKIHGKNFSIMVSPTEVVACTREQPIPKQEQDSFGHKKMMPFLTRVCKETQSYFGKNIQVYFELFGGSYPHPHVPEMKEWRRIMKGVFYCPFYDIRVIDIKVDGSFLNWDEMVEIALRHKLKPALELKRGRFEELLEMDANYPDPTYKDYGYPALDGNITEGFVLRPLREAELNNGKRVILKKKSDKFKEKASKPRVRKEAAPLPENLAIALDELSKCITEQRVQNIFSHGKMFSHKDFPVLATEMTSDIIKEEKEEDYFVALGKNERKVLFKHLMKMVSEAIREDFKENLEA